MTVLGTSYPPSIKTRIYERLVKNQKNSGKSRLTEELILLDKRRDRALIALRDIIHGMSVSLPDETVRQ